MPSLEVIGVMGSLRPTIHNHRSRYVAPTQLAEARQPTAWRRELPCKMAMPINRGASKLLGHQAEGLALVLQSRSVKAMQNPARHRKLHQSRLQAMRMDRFPVPFLQTPLSKNCPQMRCRNCPLRICCTGNITGSRRERRGKFRTLIT